MAKANWAAAAMGAAALCISAPANAQTQLFSSDTELQIAIEGPIGDIVRRAARNTDAAPATLLLDTRNFDIALSPRGISRRTLGICQFPPMRLTLIGPRQGTVFQGQNKLKLVTRCRPGASYEQLTVLEYTAYRLYNEITPLSFHVRPVRVTYRDNASRRREETQFNFLIEDVDDVARRNRRVALNVQSGEVASSQLDGEQAAIVTMFQFMIGNLDWDMVDGRPNEDCCHNGKLMGASAISRERVVPVPYDFDFSGLVNAPYATPPQGLPVPTVRQRYYRGLCRYNEQARAAAELFRARRDRLYAVIDGETRLTESRRSSAREYIEGFFETLDNPQRFERQIIGNCRR
jgi:hypothetical protein